MPSPSPFADIADGPADDAVVVPLGGTTRTALGCFGLTTLFLAVVAVAALSYSVFGVPGPAHATRSLHVVAAVLGGLFLLIVIGLGAVAVRAVRGRHAIAFDAAAVWCRPDRVPVRMPWQDIAVVRVVGPHVVKGIRTSTPRTPAVEITLVSEDAVRNYRALAGSVTSGEPVRDGLPTLRFAFRLAADGDRRTVTDAVTRFAQDTWME